MAAPILIGDESVRLRGLILQLLYVNTNTPVSVHHKISRYIIYVRTGIDQTSWKTTFAELNYLIFILKVSWVTSKHPNL